MKTILFKKDVRLPAKTKQDLARWGELAGMRFLEGGRYRFEDQHESRLRQHYADSIVVESSDEIVEPDDQGIPPWTVTTHIDDSRLKPIDKEREARLLRERKAREAQEAV